MDFFDAVIVDGEPRETRDGYMLFDARAARTGIQIYTGSEVGKPEMDIVRVYRPAKEVFAPDSMRSFAFKPMTKDHPPERVTADNWKKYGKGIIGGEISQDGKFISVPMMMMDRDLINAWRSGKKQISSAYSCDLDWTPGQTESGELFDATQTNIRINHVAVVDAARGGPELSLPVKDSNTGKEPAMKVVMIDGISVNVDDAHAQIVERTIAKLTADAEAKDKAIADAETAHKKAIEAKDEDIGKLKVELKTAQDAIVTPEALDKMVADRAALVTVVKALDASIKVEGVSDADLRKAAVTAKVGADMVKDSSDAEIGAMFKLIAKDVKPSDPLAAALGDNATVQGPDKAVADAYTKMVQDSTNAWMGSKAAD